MKIKLLKPSTLKPLILGLGLAGAFESVTVFIFSEKKKEPGKHYSMPKNIALPKRDVRYSEVLGMN